MDSETLKDFTVFISGAFTDDGQVAANPGDAKEKGNTRPTKSDLLLAISHLAQVEVYVEADLIELFPSKWAKTKVLALLSNCLINFHGINDPELRPLLIFEVAHKCVSAREEELAAELMKAVYEMAMQKEDLALVSKLWALAEIMEEPPDLGPVSAHQALKREMNYYEIKHLWGELGEIRKDPDVQNKIRRWQEVLDHPLLAHPSKALTKRAEHWYWKVKASCLILLTDYETAIPLQRTLVQLIRECPWVSLHVEYGTAKEMRILYQILERANFKAEAREVINELDALPLTVPLAIMERARAKYPFIISFATTHGDAEEGQKAFDSFLELLDSGTIQLDPPYIAENLYVCGYFCIASQNLNGAAKIIARLQKFGKNDFRPKYLALARLLKIIYDIECSSWDDALQGLKNAKRSSLEDLPVLYEVFLYLEREIKQLQNASDTKELKPFSTAPEKLMSSLEGQAILNYFDIIAWMKSRKEGRPMMEIFYQRAISASQ